MPQHSQSEPAPENSAQIQLPAKLGSYLLHQKLAVGRWADVYSASCNVTSVEQHWDYAVKVLRPELQADALANRLLQREYYVGSQVSDMHLVPVLDAELDLKTRYLVMPRLHGSTVGDILTRQNRIDPPKALWVARQAAQGLAALHHAGWLHADVHPHNLLMDAKGHVTLIDLGLARRLRSDECHNNVVAVGTLAFGAPEMTCSGMRIDSACDIYSLGVILFQMLAGEHPFGTQDSWESVLQRKQQHPTDVRRQLPLVTKGAANLLKRMLATDPLRRPTAEELCELLVRLEIESFDHRGLKLSA